MRLPALLLPVAVPLLAALVAVPAATAAPADDPVVPPTGTAPLAGPADSGEPGTSPAGLDRPVPAQGVTEVVGGIAELRPCPERTGLLVWQTRSTAGQPVEVTVTGTPGEPVSLSGYSRPGTVGQVIGTGTLQPDGTARFVVQPATSSRYWAQQGECPVSTPSVLQVTTEPTLDAAPGPVFTGTVLPARSGVLVNLYRRSERGLVLAAQTRTRADGTYRVTRRFLSSGRHVFVVRTGADANNATGQSPARAVVLP